MKRLDHTAACEHLARVDRQLARIIAHHGPCRLQQETTQSIFEALLEAIIYQQLTGKVAATILGRVKALFPENAQRIPTRRGWVDGFPTPEQILAASDERLRSAGLSRAKALAIRDLAAKALDGTVPTVKQAHRMNDEELIERLDTVRGIGRWTVEMLLIFRLGRPDVLPIDDYGVRKGFAQMRKLKELPKPKDLLVYGERWRPYRSVASWYLWRAAEMKALPMAGRAEKKVVTLNSNAGVAPKKSAARQR
ncbi:MAG TPA: DNA-3-methyladenine glycosylase [Terriglobales bacterium]|nr:DNA-3-methyladenine glycosylase [Terriglobales bacterium]